MARIREYELDRDLEANDKVLGTDYTDGGTMNFSIEQLGAFLASRGLADPSALDFQFSHAGNEEPGLIQDGEIYYNSILPIELTRVYISNTDLKGLDTGPFANYLQGAVVEINDAGTTLGTDYGFYDVSDVDDDTRDDGIILTVSLHVNANVIEPSSTASVPVSEYVNLSIIGFSGAVGTTGPAGFTPQVSQTQEQEDNAQAAITYVQTSNQPSDFILDLPRGLQGEDGPVGPRGYQGNGVVLRGTSREAMAGEATTLLFDNTVIDPVTGVPTVSEKQIIIQPGAQGAAGDRGLTGNPGEAGDDATVSVGSTDTLTPGEDAMVTDSDPSDPSNVVLNFGIPRGAAGTPGAQGSYNIDLYRVVAVGVDISDIISADIVDGVAVNITGDNASEWLTEIPGSFDHLTSDLFMVRYFYNPVNGDLTGIQFSTPFLAGEQGPAGVQGNSVDGVTASYVASGGAEMPTNTTPEVGDDTFLRFSLDNPADTSLPAVRIPAGRRGERGFSIDHTNLTVSYVARGGDEVDADTTPELGDDTLVTFALDSPARTSLHEIRIPSGVQGVGGIEGNSLEIINVSNGQSPGDDSSFDIQVVDVGDNPVGSPSNIIIRGGLEGESVASATRVSGIDDYTEDSSTVFPGDTVFVGFEGNGGSELGIVEIPSGSRGINGEPGVQGRFNVNVFQSFAMGDTIPATVTFNIGEDGVITSDLGDWSLTPTNVENEDLYEGRYNFDPAGGAVVSASFAVFRAGESGPAGRDGLPGDAGESAYEAYVATTTDNPVLSEAAWVDSLAAEDGNGIVSILRTAGDGSEGTEDTYTITYTDGTTDTITVQNGSQGQSAYDVYVGTVPEGETPLTLTEWIVSLRGANGIDGVNGVEGAQGLSRIELYIDVDLAPPPPTGVVLNTADFTFATITPDWSATFTSGDWLSFALVNPALFVDATYAVPDPTWSTPVLATALGPSGPAGPPGTDGADGVDANVNALGDGVLPTVAFVNPIPADLTSLESRTLSVVGSGNTIPDGSVAFQTAAGSIRFPGTAWSEVGRITLGDSTVSGIFRDPSAGIEFLVYGDADNWAVFLSTANNSADREFVSLVTGEFAGTIPSGDVTIYRENGTRFFSENYGKILVDSNVSTDGMTVTVADDGELFVGTENVFQDPQILNESATGFDLSLTGTSTAVQIPLTSNTAGLFAPAEKVKLDGLVDVVANEVGTATETLINVTIDGVHYNINPGSVIPHTDHGIITLNDVQITEVGTDSYDVVVDYDTERIVGDVTVHITLDGGVGTVLSATSSSSPFTSSAVSFTLPEEITVFIEGTDVAGAEVHSNTIDREFLADASVGFDAQLGGPAHVPTGIQYGDTAGPGGTDNRISLPISISTGFTITGLSAIGVSGGGFIAGPDGTSGLLLRTTDEYPTTGNHVASVTVAWSEDGTSNTGSIILRHTINVYEAYYFGIYDDGDTSRQLPPTTFIPNITFNNPSGIIAQNGTAVTFNTGDAGEYAILNLSNNVSVTDFGVSGGGQGGIVEAPFDSFTDRTYTSYYFRKSYSRPLTVTINI